MSKPLQGVIALILSLSLLLVACGDNPTTTTSVPTNPASVTTTRGIASTIQAATSGLVTTTTAAAPVTTVVAPATTAVAMPMLTQYPLTVVDGGGYTLIIPKKPERVICLHIICADMLAELGVEPFAIDESQALQAAKHPKFFGDKAETWIKLKREAGINLPSPEILASLKPDLILNYHTTFAPIRDAKIAPLFGHSGTGTLEDAIDEMKTLAKILDRTAQAQEAEKRFKARLAIYQAKSPKNVSVMVSNSVAADSLQLQIATEKTPTCALFSSVAKCDWQLPTGVANNSGFLNTSLEKILQTDPDVIIIRVYNDQDRKRALEDLPNNSFWKELKAVKNKRVHVVNSYVWGGFGTRMLNTMLDEGMPLLYPEVFREALP
jgi:iron complex transport system substrate-binding protein